MRPEAKVGLFVLFGLFALFALSTRVQTIHSIGKEGYVIHAYVDNASGLEENTKVKVNGVEAGYITAIALEGGKAKLDLFMFQGTRLSTDSTAIIAQESMLGGRFVDIRYGKSDQLMQPGDALSEYKAYASFDQTSDTVNGAADEFRKLMEKMNDVMDQKTRNDLKEAIANFKTMAAALETTGTEFTTAARTLNQRLPRIMEQLENLTAHFDKAGTTVNEKLPAIVAQVDGLTREFNRTGSTLNENLPRIMEQVTAVIENTEEILYENKEPLNNAIVSADNFFSSGGKTFTKLNTMLSKVNKAEIAMGLRSEYMASDGYGKNYFDLAYRPRPTSFYMLGITVTDDYTRTDPVTGELIEPELHEEGKTMISAQMGKRYDDWLFRAGIIESSGGGAVDYFAYRDAVKYTFELFDFNAVNDIRGENPHAKLSVAYEPFKHVNLYAGYDNFLNAEAATLFMGLGVRFIDDDLKYLLTSSAGAAAAAN